MLTLEKGARLCGRFTLVERIGTGGQGEIWRATDDTAGADIALKVLHPEVARSADAWESLRHEYAVAQRLGHPGIVEIGEPVRDEVATVLPMTLATGDLRRFRGEPYTRIVPVLLEVAAALEHAHSRGVVHRDIKPSNVLIDQDGHINVADFGAASLDGAVLGRGAHSPFSASPQQLEGEPPALSDDIYGLGALAYELLSGYPPYYPDFEPRAVLGEPVPDIVPIHTAPPRLLRLVVRMLAKDPDDRPASMRDVQEELQAALYDTVAEAAALDNAPVDLADDQAASHISTARLREAAMQALAAGARMPAAQDIAVPATDAPLLTVAAVSSAAALPAPAEGVAGVVPEPPVLSPAFGAAVSARLDALPEERVELTAGARDDVLIGSSTDSTPDEGAAQGGSHAGSVLKWFGLAALAAALVGVFVYLPRVAEQRAAAGATARTAPAAGGPVAAAQAADPAQQFAALHEKYSTQLAALEARGAAVWGGVPFASARALGVDAVAASNAGASEIALDRVKVATQRLDRVAAAAAATAKEQLDAGERALAGGELLVAQQAFELAQRIEPENAQARDGLERATRLAGVLPQLAAADNALAANDAARAIQLYGTVLAADPRNAAAQAGLERARASAGNDAFARQMGEALGALRSGDFDAARAALNAARALRPEAPEVAAGFAELASAQAGRGLASVRERATALEAQERWADALAEYTALLRTDPGVEFALAGKARVAPRAELAAGLQALIDRPERLAAPEVRAEADALLARARSQAAGAVLRAQVARLEALLPAWDIPVRIAFESDGQTNVDVQRHGALGTFERQELELKPGRYTVVGTRPGYRDVRREVTVAPGQPLLTVAVRCVDPVR